MDKKQIDLDKISKEKSIEELLQFGIINVDKPAGPTSFAVSEFVKDTLGLKKTSHFGTLDPKVTGVLPVALNRACKLTGYFIGHYKTYVGIMRIHKEKSLKEIQEVINAKFLGKIKQIPPVRSRVKRQERERNVKKFELLEKDGNDVLFVVEVQGGTYIRKLIHDLGVEMKTGAHMLELRRSKAGIFSEHNEKYPSVSLYELEKAVEEFKKGNEKPLRKIIIPAEIISEVYPVVQIKSEIKDRILTGKPIFLDNLVEEPGGIPDSAIVVAFSGAQFIGVYRVVMSGKLFAKPLFVFQPVRV